MDVKEAFTQEMRRVLLDMMECYVDHVVKGITHRAESVVSVQEKKLWE